eukprot:IDg5459t1
MDQFSIQFIANWNIVTTFASFSDIMKSSDDFNSLSRTPFNTALNMVDSLRRDAFTASLLKVVSPLTSKKDFSCQTDVREAHSCRFTIVLSGL